MNIKKEDIGKGQIELTVEVPFEEFKKYFNKGAEEVSQEIKIEGFRPGKAPFEIVKQKVGELAILEKAARIAINKTIGEATKEIKGTPVAQPEVNITKLAPNNPLEYKVIVSLLPETSLGEYKNFGVKKEEVKIDDKEVEKTLEQLREMRAKEVIVDRPVQESDKVVVDIDMFLDKVSIEGGQGKDTNIIIGKKYIVPGLDDKIIGMKKGEEREFKLPYPKDHYQKNIAGKMVEFKVKVKEIYEREFPKLDNQFAKSLGSNSVDELKDMLKKNIIEEKEQKSKEKVEIQILEKIIKNSKFGDIPEILINKEVETMMAELEKNIISQGGKFEDYLTSIRKTKGDLMLEFSPAAVKRIKTALIIREISIKEKISAEPKEVEEELEKLKTQYKGYEKVDDYISRPEYKDYLYNAITNRKVLKKLQDWNVK